MILDRIGRTNGNLCFPRVVFLHTKRKHRWDAEIDEIMRRDALEVSISADY